MIDKQLLFELCWTSGDIVGRHRVLLEPSCGGVRAHRRQIENQLEPSEAALGNFGGHPGISEAIWEPS